MLLLINEAASLPLQLIYYLHNGILTESWYFFWYVYKPECHFNERVSILTIIDRKDMRERTATKTTTTIRYK